MTAGSRGAPALMVVGTGSHAGKTVLVAALCRIYARRGLRVVPFKAQNMALNSYVTPEGGELGRAQAYQAAAAGVEPHVDMNPILLKPSSHDGCQVVAMGAPVGHMSVREYHDYQPEGWRLVTSALSRLREENDLVVIEGAGSAAEVNLRDRDIVNMRVAVHAAAPTLLVGDIDRGGVFASLVGTLELLSAEERDLIRAFVINKFRGDVSLLEPGLDFLRERTGVPTIGVVPVLDRWRGDEEDSLGIEDRMRRARPDAPVQVAVVRLPYVSNFTDFDALADEQDVAVRYVSSPEELEGAAAVVLPGTKSTVHDLEWLRDNGLADALAAAAAGGTPVIGICGGFQMLGRRILDPDRVESSLAEIDGLGLLEVETTFEAEKRTTRVTGELSGAALGPAGTPLHGYEIHMGRSRRGPDVRPLCRIREPGGAGHDDGAAAPAAPVCGTYVHGLFDHADLRDAFLDGLRRRVGVDPGAAAREADASGELDRLADHVERHLDMGMVDRLIEEQR